MSCDECPSQTDGFIILLLITVFSMRSANKFCRLLCFIGKKQTKPSVVKKATFSLLKKRSFDTWSSAKETQTGSQITPSLCFWRDLLVGGGEQGSVN